MKRMLRWTKKSLLTQATPTTVHSAIADLPGPKSCSCTRIFLQFAVSRKYYGDLWRQLPDVALQYDVLWTRPIAPWACLLASPSASTPFLQYKFDPRRACR